MAVQLNPTQPMPSALSVVTVLKAATSQFPAVLEPSLRTRGTRMRQIANLVLAVGTVHQPAHRRVSITANLVPQMLNTKSCFNEKPNYPCSYDYPLAHLITSYKASTNHEASRISYHFASFGYLGIYFLTKGFKYSLLVTYIGTSVITCCRFALANGRLALVCTV